MKNITFVVVLLAVGIAAYMWWPKLMPREEQVPVEQTQKLMSVEDYVSQNISALSPVKETVGGTFYVTAIEVRDGEGTVSYEDGHNAYTADFTYTSSDLTGHNITSFEIRD